jgi:methionyl aminopeptidase
MKLNNNNMDCSFVQLQNDNFLQRQRIAGKVVADTLSLLENLVKDKTKLTLLELDIIAKEYIEKNDCVCTFAGYKGFPGNICVSLNRELVHGIGDKRTLNEGDVISFDLGATFDNAIADSALTCIYGQGKPEHIKGIEITNLCLDSAIASISVGKRIGVIGNAIYKTARSNGFDVILSYGGHGISMTTEDIGIPHAQPFISNKSSPEEGCHIQQCMTIAIEPLLVPLGSSIKTKTAADNWTVLTDEIGFHSEHTLYIHKDNVEIITKRN